MRTERHGQALIELAVGMVTITLVVSLLTGYCVFMTRSLKAQNSARSGGSDANGEVTVDLYTGGAPIEKLTVKERVNMPQLEILR